jgi:hypothetical protein
MIDWWRKENEEAKKLLIWYLSACLVDTFLTAV